MRKLPLDKSNLNLNAWFSGMTDAEGYFFFISLAGVYFINNSSSTIINRVKYIYYIKERIIKKFLRNSMNNKRTYYNLYHLYLI